MAYRFPPNVSAGSLVDRLEQLGWWAQIIGPHGSGKSTLVHSLLPYLEQRNRDPRLITLSAGQRRLPWRGAEQPGWSTRTLVVLDGYEQLGLWNRWRLRRRCSIRLAGLLVTTHRDAGFPTLFQTHVTADLARSLVADLLADSSVPIAVEDVDAALTRHQQNLREVLFDLYDLYERRRRNGARGGDGR
jgi:hypothetical protein